MAFTRQRSPSSRLLYPSLTRKWTALSIFAWFPVDGNEILDSQFICEVAFLPVGPLQNIQHKVLGRADHKVHTWERFLLDMKINQIQDYVFLSLEIWRDIPCSSWETRGIVSSDNHVCFLSMNTEWGEDKGLVY